LAIIALSGKLDDFGADRVFADQGRITGFGELNEYEASY